MSPHARNAFSTSKTVASWRMLPPDRRVRYGAAMRILVVEDDLRIADLLRRVLGEASYSVDVTHATAPALEAFALESYDLVILDLLLPGAPGGGMEVCRVMRQENKDVPILMLTALDSPRNRVNGLAAGADDYLTKPFHLQEL